MAATVDPVTEPTILVELAPWICPPHGIITTQSCDIDEEAESKKKPWVQVAPVYQLALGDGRLGQVRRWQVGYLAPVPTLGPEWVADLRVEFPIEKSWLVSQEPRSAFDDPRDFDRFGQHCGRSRMRTAFATSIFQQVLGPLERFIAELRSDRPDLYDALLSDDQHLFLDVQGDLLAPDVVQLIFVRDGGIPEDLKGRLARWWTETFGGHRAAIPILENRYLSFDDVRFSESRKWHEQPLRGLDSSS